MGLVMDTGSVKSQLEEMNSQLDVVEENAFNFTLAIFDFKATAFWLQAEAYDQLREVYSEIHMPILKGIIAYSNALRVQNNTYRNYIDNFLSGIGYVDEDALKRDKERLEQQISYVRNDMVLRRGSYSDYLGCLERTLELACK